MVKILGDSNPTSGQAASGAAAAAPAAPQWPPLAPSASSSSSSNCVLGHLDMTAATVASFANFYYLANYFHQQQHQHYVAAASAAYDQQQQQHQQAAATAGGHKAAKRRKLEPGIVAPEETRLLSKRGPVTFKPYSDNVPLREPVLQIGGRRSGEKSLLPQKRKYGQRTGLISGEGQSGFSRGDSEKVTRERVDKKTLEKKKKKSELRATTVENLFPEILTNIFEYLDVQSKGRAARVSQFDLFKSQKKNWFPLFFSRAREDSER